MPEKTVESRLDDIENTLLSLTAQLKEMKIRGEAYDSKLDAYQRASSQVINLAFGLIITAVLAIIIPAVVGGGHGWRGCLATVSCPC